MCVYVQQKEARWGHVCVAYAHICRLTYRGQRIYYSLLFSLEIGSPIEPGSRPAASKDRSSSCFSLSCQNWGYSPHIDISLSQWFLKFSSWHSCLCSKSPHPGTISPATTLILQPTDHVALILYCHIIFDTSKSLKIILFKNTGKNTVFP